MCSRYLSQLKMWVGFTPVPRCTWYNLMRKSESCSSAISMVFIVCSCFSLNNKTDGHDITKNIVEFGVTPITLGNFMCNVLSVYLSYSSLLLFHYTVYTSRSWMPCVYFENVWFQSLIWFHSRMHIKDCHWLLVNLLVVCVLLFTIECIF